ncbi:hypothetical protein [Blautia producta]|uniref:hypothetical protein n=1 Tax=Blautia producta TaxID=33035 RepID=UPI0031B60510
MNKKKLAIVGIFYDGYVDIWRDFIRYFKIYWADCPYDFYIVDNEIQMDIDNITFINAGKDAEYSRKVQMAIEQINADYYLLLLEDFFFGTRLDKDILEPIMNFIEEEKIEYYGISSLSSFSKYKSNLYDVSKGYLYKINPKNRYTLGCQAVIWEKNFLKRCIGTRNYNAWVFEGAFTKSKKVHTDEFLKKCVKDTRNILQFKHGVLQQKLLPETVEYYRQIGNPITSNRDTMSEKDFSKYVRNSKVAALIPRALHEPLKKIVGEKRGNAVLDKYEQQIQVVIKESFGE